MVLGIAPLGRCGNELGVGNGVVLGVLAGVGAGVAAGVDAGVAAGVGAGVAAGVDDGVMCGGRAGDCDIGVMWGVIRPHVPSGIIAHSTLLYPTWPSHPSVSSHRCLFLLSASSDSFSSVL